MSLSLATLRASLIDQLGLLSIDEMIPTASLNRSINAGLRRMTREMDWPWLKATTTISLVKDQDIYALPAGLVRVSAVGLDAQVISALSAEAMIEQFNESGAPLFYVVEGSNIRLSPIPNDVGTLKIVYTKPETVLSSDGDTVLAPDIYEDVIVTYAAIHQATRLKDQQLLGTLEMVRKQTLDTMRRDVLKTSRAPRLQTRDDL